ncbi:hypothetical protein EI94DRAFT_1734606 [Lactarius quietus]|nr:hypothetical protein EI94DRAFT_1734606 [Lactarius quietus]
MPLALHIIALARLVIILLLQPRCAPRTCATLSAWFSFQCHPVNGAQVFIPPKGFTVLHMTADLFIQASRQVRPQRSFPIILAIRRSHQYVNSQASKFRRY